MIHINCSTGYEAKDIHGISPEKGICCMGSDMPDPLVTNLPVDEVIDALGGKWMIQASSDAGRYLCEFVFRTSLGILNNRMCVFLHFPPVGFPYTQDELNAALLDVIKECVNVIE